MGSIPVLAAVWSYLTQSVRGATLGAAPPAGRVRPTDRYWPTAASWEKLTQQVGGQLISVVSPLAPCMDAPGSTACAARVEEMKNPYFIADQAGGTQTSGWLGGWTSQLFFVHHGFGNEEWSADGFTRLAGGWCIVSRSRDNRYRFR